MRNSVESLQNSAISVQECLLQKFAIIANFYTCSLCFLKLLHFCVSDKFIYVLSSDLNICGINKRPSRPLSRVCY